MINALLKLAIKNTKHRRVRSWLTIIGIIIGIGSIVTLVTVSDGLEYAIEEQFEKLGVSNIRVIPKGLRGPPTETNVLTEDDVNTVKRVKGLDYVIEILIQNAKVEYNNKENFIQINSIPPKLAKDAFKDNNIEIGDGRNLEPGDTYSVIIGATIGDDIFNKEILVKNSIKIVGKKFRVIGTLKKTGTSAADRAIYIPLETARDLFEKPDAISVISVKVQDGIEVSSIKDKIEVKLERARDNKNFDVITSEQIIQQFSLIIGVVQLILVGIAAISLIVGGIGIMNSMYTSVLERTRDIGIMKAIGARNIDVLFIFLFEAGMLGLLGGLIGGIIGTALSFAVGGIASSLDFGLLIIRIHYDLIIFGTIFAFVVGVVSGLAPAYRAAKLKPVDALRYE